MSWLAKPNDTTAYLVLVRHAATSANRMRPSRLQGRRTNLPLCDSGVVQAAALARFLAPCPLSRVLASPLHRAAETAQMVAEPHGLAVEPCEQVVECDVGRWEGMTWEDIQQREPESYQAFMQDPARFGYAEGENFTQVLQRAVPALNELMAASAGQVVAVVSHNVTNRVYLATLLGVPLQLGRRIPQNNAGINVIRYRAGDAKLISLNTICHLDAGSS